MKFSIHPALLALALIAAPSSAPAQTPDAPDWALPGSATHQQVPPPAGFHRATKSFNAPLGVFGAQSDIGAALAPGSASYDDASKRYTINSAGYNIWYNRDEFRYLWTKMSGDVSLAASVTFPNAAGYGDRKAVLVIRQDLDDDSKEMMVALHGAGLIHLAQRPAKNADIREDFKLPNKAAAAGAPPIRIGIEKHGDTFTLFVSLAGEPIHAVGTTGALHLDGPFYVGVGFTSHQPVTVDSSVLSDVVLEGAAGKVR
jgi:hypothetical protein